MKLYHQRANYNGNTILNCYQVFPILQDQLVYVKQIRQVWDEQTYPYSIKFHRKGSILKICEGIISRFALNWIYTNKNNKIHG